jgi:hypothetical protein
MVAPLRSQLLYGDFKIGRQDDAWQVIPTAWVRAAQKRWTETPPAGQVLTCRGVDVAYGGADAIVIAPRYGPWFGQLQKYRGAVTDSGPLLFRISMVKTLRQPVASGELSRTAESLPVPTPSGGHRTVSR